MTLNGLEIAIKVLERIIFKIIFLENYGCKSEFFFYWSSISGNTDPSKTKNSLNEKVYKNFFKIRYSKVNQNLGQYDYISNCATYNISLVSDLN